MSVRCLALTLLLAAPLLVTACGGSSPPPPDEPIAPADPPPEPKADEPEPKPEPTTDAEPEAAAGATDSAAAGDGADTASREIKYFVSPDGMRVETAGVQFTPSAEAVRVGAGWGVKVQVQAKARDGKPHSLLVPKGGELAFAGTVRRAQGEPEEFGDKRENDDELTLEGDKSAKLARTWPAKGGPKPVSAGDELELSVGVWGVGDDASSRRPVRKLALVRLTVEKGKGKVTVKQPEGIAK